MELQRIQNGRFCLNLIGLKELDAIYHIRQIRFYCKTADGQSTIDIATENTKKGKQVVDHFLGKSKLEAENACGGYYKLPDDNSKMASDCTKMNWAATVENWYSLVEWPMYRTDSTSFRFYFARNTVSGWRWWACDDYSTSTTKAGGQWMVYVR